ncbi:MAG: ABC transporter permease, partial [Clostridiaceae bacterium]|nr:ABC transporter permease [Clostridiaceae bacterium]
MIQFLYRRIINNKWLFICLLTGVIFACGIFASVPMYSSAILQKVLTKDLENYHVQTGISPGAYSVIMKEQAGNDPDTSKKLEDVVQRQLNVAYGLPIDKKLRQVTCASLRLLREGDEAFNDKRMYAQMVSLKDYGEHIKILRGRLPEGTPQNGIYEAAVTEEALGRMNLLLDSVYILASVKSNINPPEIIKFKITGVFTVQDKNELYWSDERYDKLKNSLVFYDGIPEKLAYDIDELKIESIDNTYFFDYRAIKIGEVIRINDIFQGQLRWNVKNMSLAEIKLPAVEVLKSYGQREKQLGITLWILTIPLMIIICFYTLMISALIIKNDRNEIAILKSRGAGRFQIFFLYVLESIAVAGIAFVSGPYVAYMICSILGSSNGFLEFVTRKALPLNINAHAYLYSLIGAAVFLIFMLVPALKASTKGIVHHKRSLAAENEKPLWKRFYLDFLVMGLSIYGLYSFKNRQALLSITGIKGTDLGVDPLLFFISTFFILGVSLVFLRIYPLLMRLVFQLGVRWWNPVLYFSLVNVSRADKNQQSIMLFIILALSFGIINSSQARTINSNMVDRIMYKNGADVIIEPYNNLKHLTRSSHDQTGSASTTSEKYKEPNYQEYCSIEGVESMTKVFIDNGATLTNGVERIANVRLMGITPHEFGNTVWFRKDLLPYHINEYLNLLSGAQRAALLSSGLRDKYGFKKGDNIYIDWGKGNLIDCTVYGFIDYFPSYNPYTEKTDAGDEGKNESS